MADLRNVSNDELRAELQRRDEANRCPKHGQNRIMQMMEDYQGIGVVYVYDETYYECPYCSGTNIGDLCPVCSGRGGWWDIDWSSKRPHEDYR